MNPIGWILSMGLAGATCMAQSVAQPTSLRSDQAQPPVPIEAAQLRIRHRPPAPAYPALARIVNSQGTVTLRLTIGPTGLVEAAEALDGPLLLRPAAAAFCRQWTFEPVEIGGLPSRVRSDIQLPFHLKEGTAAGREVQVSQAVLEIETVPSPTAVAVDSRALQQEAGAWLAQIGLKQVGRAEADPAAAIHLRVMIQTLRTHDGLCIQNLLVRASSHPDRELKMNRPGEAPRICFVNHVLGQAGESGFAAGLLGNLRRSLRELLVSPALPGSPGGDMVKDGQAPGPSEIVDLDFSQIRVRKQPPTPIMSDFIPDHGNQGQVVLQVLIDPAGLPASAEALTGPPELFMTAIRLAMKWEFEPVRVGGVPRAARFRLTIPFYAREDPAAPARTRRR